MECGHDRNYYYESCENFADVEEYYYPMILTDVDGLIDERKMRGIWQSGKKDGDTSYLDKVPDIYSEYSKSRDVGVRYFPMRPVIELSGNVKLTNYNNFINEENATKQLAKKLYIMENWKMINVEKWEHYGNYYEKNKDGNWYWIDSEKGSNYKITDEDISYWSYEADQYMNNYINDYDIEKFIEIIKLYNDIKEKESFELDGVYYTKNDKGEFCWNDSIYGTKKRTTAWDILIKKYFININEEREIIKFMNMNTNQVYIIIN